MNKTKFTVSEDKKSLVMERTFNATQDKLWSAYSDKEMFEQWFAPQGWSVTSKKFNFVNGGENVYVMKCEDEAQGEWFGKTSAGKMVFDKISPKSAFEYTDFFTDDNGVVNAEMPTSTSALELIANENTTILRIITTYQTEEGLKQVLEMGMQEGYGQTLDKLEQILSNQK
jgi:uncharacterized protein YndB with AHSA1/START domain